MLLKFIFFALYASAGFFQDVGEELASTVTTDAKYYFYLAYY